MTAISETAGRARPGTPDASWRHRLLQERTTQLAARGDADTPAAATAQPALIVTLGAEIYGIPLPSIATILPYRGTTPLPSAPAAVLGLISRHSRLYRLLDLRVLMHIAVAPPEAGSGHVLLLASALGRTGLYVDRAERVASLAPADTEALDGGRETGIMICRVVPSGDTVPLLNLPALLPRASPRT